MAGPFTNLDGSTNPHGISTLLKWKLNLHDETRPKSPATGVAVPAVDNDGRDLRKALIDNVTWIGHASFLVQLGGTSALIDPVLSPTLSGVVKRNVAPGLTYATLPRPDVVVVTHNHRDHMDMPTLKAVAPGAVCVVPLGLGASFRRAGFARVVELGWWDTEQVGAMTITFVPAQHWSRRGLNDQNKTLWGGYVLAHDGLAVYHSGDTAWFDGFRDIGTRCGPIEAALLPIGAYAPRWFMKTQHMNPEDAVQAFSALGAERFVAMHWATFKLTDEPLDEPPRLLREAWAQADLPDDRRLVPAIGETLRL